MHVQEWLQTIPPVAVYLLVALVIGAESVGIPLPGEIVLVSAALLASQHVADPVLVGLFAVIGAVVGDSIGYAVGRRSGKRLFARLGRTFPRHFGPGQLASAESAFLRWGMWAVFIGRFIALLRIFAGPIAGTLRMPYWKFLIANVLGGITWAGGTTAAVYLVGVVAEAWLQRFSYLGLVLAALVGLVSVLVVRRRAGPHPEGVAEREPEAQAEPVRATD